MISETLFYFVSFLFKFSNIITKIIIIISSRGITAATRHMAMSTLPVTDTASTLLHAPVKEIFRPQKLSVLDVSIISIAAVDEENDVNLSIYKNGSSEQ